MARSKKTIMKPLKNENLKDLTVKVLDLVARTGVEIGHKTDRETLANLSKVFAQDLIQEKRFGNMTFNQIEDAFRLGVRFGKEEPFLNIRTFYRWAYAHKKVIDNAYYEVHTLGQKNVPFYQEPIKLLK
jgi:aryl-alcohol dehydrogenase-like predicted oxidoreductase